jgi:hypothetical protein
MADGAVCIPHVPLRIMTLWLAAAGLSKRVEYDTRNFAR